MFKVRDKVGMFREWIKRRQMRGIRMSRRRTRRERSYLYSLLGAWAGRGIEVVILSA